MTHTTRRNPEFAMDDVDRIVATLLANPSRADDMKSLLRQKLSAHGDVRVALPTRPRAPQHRDDVEDMWDNVPV